MKDALLATIDRDLTAVAAAAAAGAAMVPDAWTAATGMPINVLLLSLAGSLLGLRWIKPGAQDTRLWLMFGCLCSAVLGAALAVFMPNVPGFAWMQVVPAPVGGLLAAFFLQIALPVIIEEIPKRIREYKIGRS